MKVTKSLRPFFVLWSGQALSLVGSSIVQFALIWWLTQETGSATILATSSLVAFVPQIVLGPFVGVLVDRWSRRWTMFTADSAIAIATLILAALFWSDAIQIWHIFALLFVRSLGSAFQMPAMQASTSLMVPKDQLTRIQGINQVLEGSLNIVGAPLGALFLTLLPMQGVLAIDVVTALFAILPLLFIRVPQPNVPLEAATNGAKPSFWSEMRLGFAYVWSWPGVLILMLLAMMVNFILTPAIVLLPLLVTQHFMGGAWELSILQSTFGIGIIAGGLLLGAWGGFKKRVLTTLLGLIGLGIGFTLIGLSPASLYWLAVLGAFLTGGMIALTNGPVRAIFQAAIAPEMQGRVMTLLGSLASAMTPLALILSGPLVDLFGIRIWFIVGGLVTVVVGLSGFFMPALLTVEDGRSAPITNTVNESQKQTTPAQP